jgi:hypothetical protein
MLTSRRSGGDLVTDAPCGFPSDYIDCFGKPVIRLDLGADVALVEISVWGYNCDNTNGGSEIALRFAAETDGETGFGRLHTIQHFI